MLPAWPSCTSGIRDGGWHHFTFSLLPHQGDLPRLAGVAAALNLAPPAVATPPGTCLPGMPFQIAGDGVELLAAKLAFAGSGEQIIRVLNLQPSPTVVRVGATGKAGPLLKSRLLTEEVAGDGLPVGSLELPPFAVRTVGVTKQIARKGRRP
jgi:hypothetical protein